MWKCLFKVRTNTACLAFACSRRPHWWGDGEEDSRPNHRSLRTTRCPGQQCRYPGHGQHWDNRPCSVWQDHEHQCQVRFQTADITTDTLILSVQCMLAICLLTYVSYSRSVYHLTQLCVPHLIKTKGSIVNVSSVNGQRSVGIKQLAAYVPLISIEAWHIVFSVVSWCAGLLHVQVCHWSVHTLYSTRWVIHFSSHAVCSVL